jgi:hypothetical protein
MNIADELERLGRLHQDGTLNDEEFARAKDKLLNQPDENAPPPPNTTLGEAANRYVSYQMIMGVIGFIIFAIFFFGFILPHISSRGPTFQVGPPH